jgi:hypothetical protein
MAEYICGTRVISTYVSSISVRAGPDTSEGVMVNLVVELTCKFEVQVRRSSSCGVALAVAVGAGNCSDESGCIRYLVLLRLAIRLPENVCRSRGDTLCARIDRTPRLWGRSLSILVSCAACQLVFRYSPRWTFLRTREVGS